MNVIFIDPNFQKHNLIALLDFQTNFFEAYIDSLAKYHPSIFRWTHQVINQYGDIMAFVNISTFRHPSSINFLTKQSFEESDPKRLKEDFQGFWEYVSPAWAGKFLDRWCTRVMRSRLEPMKKVAKTLRTHKPLILNWFKAKKAFSSGVVEGLNNKAKVTTKKSYGFRTYRGAEIALYHALGKLPTPL